MSKWVGYLADRLREPGTARSVAVILFAVTGAGNSQEAWESAIYLLIAALGAWSAVRPESK